MLIETPRQVGIAVSAARRDLGLTQEQVAREAGVSRQLVNKLEMGLATGISLSKLMAILNVCGCTLAVMSEGSPELDRPIASTDTRPKPAVSDYDPSVLYPLDHSLFEDGNDEAENP